MGKKSKKQGWEVMSDEEFAEMFAPLIEVTSRGAW